eukprot:7067968-Alexandrium_andersonii.AAC.1
MQTLIRSVMPPLALPVLEPAHPKPQRSFRCLRSPKKLGNAKKESDALPMWLGSLRSVLRCCL